MAFLRGVGSRSDEPVIEPRGHRVGVGSGGAWPVRGGPRPSSRFPVGRAGRGGCPGGSLALPRGVRTGAARPGRSVTLPAIGRGDGSAASRSPRRRTTASPGPRRGRRGASRTSVYPGSFDR